MAYVRMRIDGVEEVMDIRFYYDNVWTDDGKPTPLTPEQEEGFQLLRAALVNNAAYIKPIGRLYQYHTEEDGGPNGYEYQMRVNDENVPSAW